MTQKPGGVNFLLYRWPKTDELIEVAVEKRVKTITTSAGNPKSLSTGSKEQG